MNRKCSVEFNIENAAFDEYSEIEAARILQIVIDRILGGEDGGACVDLNGNQVGWWYIDLPEEAAND